MSRILRTMEQRGLIERRKSRTDARVQLVHLTRRGRSLQKKLVPIVRSLVERTLRGIEPQEIAALRKTLQRMFENLEP